MRSSVAILLGLAAAACLGGGGVLAVTQGPIASAMLILAIGTIVMISVAWSGRLFVRDAQPAAFPRDEQSAQSSHPDDRIHLDALAEPALVIDGTLRVARANAAARALLGERVLGEDVRVGLRHPAVIETIGLARETLTPVTRELTGFGRPENVFRLRAVELGDGRVLLVFADVTQTRLTERMRVDFVANASHELKTPLATILGFIETLEGPASKDEPARERFLEIMGREARRMNRLIDDLLSLSRIELDKYVSPRTAVDLSALLHDVGKTLAVRLETDDRRLRTETPEVVAPVLADRDQILQVLHNLISNALKYGRSGTPITVKVEHLPSKPPRAESMVRVSVEDQGEGIDAEHLPRLTERFYRVNTHRSRMIGGTGLGLAIVKHIVERHRGQLAIVSRPGEGTTVSFTLPEANAEPVVALQPNLPVT